MPTGVILPFNGGENPQSPPTGEDVQMIREPKTLLSLEEAYARRLTDSTGITAVQARELVALFGFDMASLVREARLLNRRVGLWFSELDGRTAVPEPLDAGSTFGSAVING
jgi:hypothetical protein